jgi:hypothetical protein
MLNYGSGVVTVAPSGQSINGSTASQLMAAGSASAPTGLLVISDGTNYEAQPLGASSGGGGGGTSYNAITLPVGGCSSGGGLVTGPSWQYVDSFSSGGCINFFGIDIGEQQLPQSGTNSLVAVITLPANWNSSGTTYATASTTEYSGQGTGNVELDLQTACITNGGAATTPSYNAVAASTVAFSNSQLMNTFTWSGIATSGSSTCHAGDLMFLQLTRNNTIGGNYAQYMFFINLTLRLAVN